MRKLDTASLIGIVVLIILALAIGTIIVTSTDLLSGGKSDLTYVTFVSEHKNGTSDTITVGYKDGIVHDYTWKTTFPKDVWTEEELDEMKAQYKKYGDENKSLKFYKMKVKETDTELIISEIYTGLDKAKNREALFEIGWLEDTEPMMYSWLESDLLSKGLVKK